MQRKKTYAKKFKKKQLGKTAKKTLLKNIIIF